MQGGRRSTTANNAKAIQSVLDKFTSRQYLTKYSLFNNLLASEELKIDISEHQLLKTIFGTKSLGERELHEFAYFHMREKKIVLYYYLLHFLNTVPKTQIVIMCNSQRLDTNELKQFLVDEMNGGNQKLQQEFNKRVIIIAIDSANKFIFNLLYLPLLVKQREFIKAVIICDINAYQSSDKSSLDKYYRKIPKNLNILAFRKDFFEYKIIVKTALSFITQGDQDITELNEKVVRYLNRKIQPFHSHFNLIVPFENIYNSAKTVEETYKSVLLRVGSNSRIQEAVFRANPFKLELQRQL